MKQWRINLIFIFIIFFGAVIISRLFFLQVLNQDYWRALAKGQQKIFLKIPSTRGEIFLRDKNDNLYPLAINKEWSLVYAAPNEVQDKTGIAQQLSGILELDQDFILERLSRETFYTIIKKKLTEEELKELKELDLTGVYLEKEKGRFYPQKFLASQTIGFLQADGGGEYGIEGYYNDILEGREGFQEGERSAQGFFLAFAEKFLPAEGGSDLVLTLDYNIQFMAEKLLWEAKENFDIEEGTIIVGDTISGEILAIANFPNFNPNQYSKVENWEIFQNSAIQKIFEPGSVFKPIVMAAGLNEKKLTPQTTYEDKGFVKVGGYTIYNYDNRVWGQRTMTEVLERSINTGAVFAESQVGHELFLKYLEKFAIFKPTGIDLEGEVFSENKEFKKGYEINFATASFGQGIEMTPIQLFRAFSAITNKGRLVKPYMVKKVLTNGEEKETQPVIAGSQIISSQTASQLIKMLVNVVEQGYAKSAKIPGYYIAGKTGTAQIAWSALGMNKSGYSDKTIQSFVGFAPAYNPRFQILVKLNNPKTKTAEYSAVPIFHDLAKYIIDYWQIPPDYE
ncbi:MAG TPA: penicillin-binding protein 2 [Candidatus Nealsonbacteria bacterium]|uniref:Penicillin-binding protein transpeptidase domain-containing protein n=1 Tax=marine sediment metagenome TaxID=412755 RepID=A0A0F9X7U6_9ZZZZ|nr:penicillin-binding protein 2 [Candidatus Nealsonbacteria bacterium]HEB46830.1 penicillin-binding protein 2 [Candidatus Nealsonbacteria bacterium]